MGYKIQSIFNGVESFCKNLNGEEYEFDTYDEAEAAMRLHFISSSQSRVGYRVFVNFTEDERDEKFFERMTVPDDCYGCSNLITCRDPFGTGDSPTEYECGIDSRKDCGGWSDDSWLIE